MQIQGYRKRRAAILVAACLTLGLSMNACLSFDTFCAEAVDCADGNEADVDACIVNQKAAEERASEFGCTEEFETFVECREQEAKCENDIYGLEGNDCDDEVRAINFCMGDSLPGSPAPF